MDINDENLIPDAVTAEEMDNSWTEAGVKKKVVLVVKCSLRDVITNALLLKRNSLLELNKISAITQALSELSSYEDGDNADFEVHNFILDQLFETGLNGTESDRDAMLSVINRLTFEKSFPLVPSMNRIFAAIRNIVFKKFPAPEEIQELVSKKPGIGKLYYLKPTLVELETDLRKLLRASEMLAYFFLMGLGKDVDDYIHRLFTDLILSGDCPTLHSFYAICSILKSIGEMRSTCIHPRGQVLSHIFLCDVYNILADFLCAFRVPNRTERKALILTHTIFTLAFEDLNLVSHSEYNKATKDTPFLKSGYCSTEEYLNSILECHYAKVYILGHNISPRLFKSDGPKFFPGKGRQSPGRNGATTLTQSEVEDLAMLLQQTSFRKSPKEGLSPSPHKNPNPKKQSLTS